MSNNNTPATQNAFTDVRRDDGAALAVQQLAQAPSAVSHSDSQRSVAEVQASLVIARANPRNEIKARDRIMQACQRVKLAEGAVYQYPRGGQSVTGPSIRLAEAAARYWGNMTYGFRELGRKDGASEVEAFAWDLETNTKAVRQFAVKHWRDTKSGGYKLKDERDIYELVANMAQRRVRAAILEIIPGDIIDDAVAECEQTLRAALPQGQDMKDVIKAMVEAFKSFGVTKGAIEARLGHKLTPTATTPGEIVGLKKIYASINDGMSGAADWFEMEDAKAEADLKAKIKGDTKPSDAKADAPPTGPVVCPNNMQTVEIEHCQKCKDFTDCPERN